LLNFKGIVFCSPSGQIARRGSFCEIMYRESSLEDKDQYNLPPYSDQLLLKPKKYSFLQNMVP
jgi:hypothetical protein